MRVVKSFLVALAVTTVAAGLAGCREEEQNRELHLEKGVYAGAPDTALTEDQRRALEQRARAQSF